MRFTLPPCTVEIRSGAAPRIGETSGALLKSFAYPVKDDVHLDYEHCRGHIRFVQDDGTVLLQQSAAEFFGVELRGGDQ